MSNYTIVISERQRAVIHAALAKLDDGRIPVDDGTDADEAVILAILFGGLPSDERETPGAVHGFCL